MSADPKWPDYNIDGLLNGCTRLELCVGEGVKCCKMELLSNHPVRGI